MTLSLNYDPIPLYAAISARHSIRSFDSRPLSEDHYRAMSAACLISSDAETGIRFLVVRGVGDGLFKGIIGGYGRITGVKDVLVMIGDTDSSESMASLGRAGEMLVLKATSLGLGTCWVSGMFKPRMLHTETNLKSGERILAVSPLGYSAPASSGHLLLKRMAGSVKRKPLTELMAPGSENAGSLSGWPLRALELARLAPSAMNRQPWRFRVKGDSITVLTTGGVDSPKYSKRMDCGICMAHIELAATACGLMGEWKAGDGLEVATYTISSPSR